MVSLVPRLRIHRWRQGTRGRLETRKGTVLLVLRGACELRSGGSRPLELAEGAAAWLAGAAQRGFWKVVCATDVMLVVMTASDGSDGELARASMAYFSPERVAQTPPLSLLAALLREELLAEKSTTALSAALAKSFALYLQRAVRDGERKRRFRRSIGDSRIWKAMTLMHEDPSKRWTVERLARAVGLSRPVFARRFVENAGVTPLRYLVHSRMELAAELLRSSGGTLAEVAARVGYASEFAFGRAFKRHHGQSPGAFRRLSAGADAIVMRSAA